MNDHVCQRRLAILWLTGGMLVLVLLAVQDLRNVYGEHSERAWSWFASTVLPTLTVIVGTVMSQARKQAAPSPIQPSAFWLSLALSAIYLLLIFATLLYQLATDLTPLDVLARSSRFLGPVQGLVGLTVGAFFGSRGAGTMSEPP